MSVDERMPVTDLIEHIECTSARSAFMSFAACGVLLGLLLVALRAVPALNGDLLAQKQVLQGGLIAFISLACIPFIRSGRNTFIAAIVIVLVLGIIAFSLFGLELGTRSASSPFTAFALLLTLTVFGLRAGLAVMVFASVLLAAAALAELGGFISGPVGDRFVNTEVNLLCLTIMYLLALGFSIFMDRQSAQLEQALRQRREALKQTLAVIEHAQSSKERFLKSLSTDIEVPLHGMVQAIESMQAEDRPAATDAGSISRMSTRVMQFLETALGSARKLSAGGLDLELCAPVQILQIRCDHWARAAQAKGLSLVQDIDAEFAPACVGPTQLYLDAINAVLDNAVRYTIQGSILVRLECTNRNAPHSDSLAWRLVVSDTGAGISEPVMRRMRAFFRERVDAQTPQGGTSPGLRTDGRSAVKTDPQDVEDPNAAGLGGLRALKRWADATGGEADILSLAGQGCIASVSFELRRAAA